MMKKTKILSIILIITIIIGVANVVNASTSSTFKANLSASTTTLKAGEEVTVTIGVSDINMGENGINTLEGKISYDTGIFEAITSSSIQSLNNWTTTYNDESSTLNGKFLAVNLSSGTKDNTQIFSVKFKVKAGITDAKDTKIEFKEITSNDGTDLVKVGDKAITIKVNGGSTNNSQDTNKENKENNSENNQGVTSGTNSKTENASTQNKATTSDKTTAKTIIPKAGKSIAVASSILILIVIVVALGIKNKTMKDIK